MKYVAHRAAALCGAAGTSVNVRRNMFKSSTAKSGSRHFSTRQQNVQCRIKSKVWVKSYSVIGAGQGIRNARLSSEPSRYA